jgi:hypothetical protein
MKRISGIAAAFVVALALAPISADAQQQISACVNNSSGTIHIVAQGAPCQSNEMALTWNAGPGGVLAGADFQCVGGVLPAPNALLFRPSGGGVTFGSGISTTGSTFSSIVLQPGIYQIHLSGTRFSPFALPGDFPVITTTGLGLINPSWGTTVSVDAAHYDIVGGDRLVSVTGPNTSVQFIVLAPFPPNTQFQGFCEVVITRLP